MKSFIFAVIKACVVLAICGLLFWAGCRNYFKGYSWHYDVDISYVYEGEDVIHHVYTDYTIYRNATVKDVDLVFSTEPGYINCLTLYINEVYGSVSESTYNIRKQIMEVPDRRFRVVDITSHKGPRLEH